MKKEQLNKILELHKKWLQGESGGERANLIGSNLRGANLRDVDLSGSNLSCADLRYTNLSGSNLRGTDLRYVNLCNSDLSDADLRGSNLRGVYLSDANLSCADLRYVDTSLLQGMTIIECQLNTSEQNRRISYWKDLDIVTVGCYQGTWAEFKERVQQVHGDNPVMKRKYDRVIAFIEAEREE